MCFSSSLLIISSSGSVTILVAIISKSVLSDSSSYTGLFKDIYELSNQKYEQNLKELVEMLGAEDILDSPVRTLSLGERMKCELIGSLIYKPEILFLDEPTIGMDLIHKRMLENLLEIIA